MLSPTNSSNVIMAGFIAANAALVEDADCQDRLDAQTLSSWQASTIGRKQCTHDIQTS